jgi:cell division protein FtsL
MAQNSNLAHALHNFETQEIERVQRPKIQKLEKRQAQAVPQKKHVLRSVLCMAYVVLLCGALIYGKVALTEQNNAMLDAQETLEEVEGEYTRLSLQADSISSLKTIEEIATTQYGMVQPDQSQINCIQVEKENKVEVASEDHSILDTINRIYQQIKEYILG